MTVEKYLQKGGNHMHSGKKNHSIKFKILGSQYVLPLNEQNNATNTTKENILMESTMLFAKKGFASVSMRDIAQKVGIKPASLYNHFVSKDALWERVIEHALNMYILYFKRLDETLEGARTFEEVLEVIFSEPKRLANVFTSYAFAMIQADQFRDKKSAKIFNGTFLEYSIEFIKNWFDRCMARGMVAEFDGKTVATFIMHSVLMGINVEIQRNLGREVAYEPEKMFADLQQFILSTLGPR
jgi:AcrR family transcriptional regulator